MLKRKGLFQLRRDAVQGSGAPTNKGNHIPPDRPCEAYAAEITLP